MIRNVDRVASALTRNEGQLEDLVTNLRVVTGSFASEDAALEQGIAELPRTLRRAAGVREPQRRVPQPPLLRARRCPGSEPRAHRDSGDAVRATAAWPRVAAGARRPRERPSPDRSPARSPVALRRRLPRAGSRARELPRQRGHSVVQRRGRRGGRVSPSCGRPGLPGDRLRPRGARRESRSGDANGQTIRPRAALERTSSPAIRRASRIRSSGSRRCRCSVECPRSSRRRRRRSAPGSRARTRIRPTCARSPARPRHRRRRGRRRRPDPGDGA